jgi:type I restriction enzyme R subunit
VGQPCLPEHDGPRVSRDCGAESLGIEFDDFDLPPFSQQGGLGRVHQLFGAELPSVLASLNASLAA